MSRAKPRPMPPINGKTLLKFLDMNHVGAYSRKKLPIGRWIKIKGQLKSCVNGIHVTRLSKAHLWLNSNCHVVEIRGEHIKSNAKICCREVYIHPALVTWNKSALDLVKMLKPIVGEKGLPPVILGILRGEISEHGAARHFRDYLSKRGSDPGLIGLDFLP